MSSSHSTSSSPDAAGRAASGSVPVPTLICCFFAAVMAGFFWSFSVVVMPGLEIMEPLAAMRAMQAINVAVKNPIFGFGFFGTLALCGIVVVYELVRHNGTASWIAILAAAVYVVGVFGATASVNVPLNRELAAVDPSDPGNAGVMISFIRDWSVWNDVRTLSSMAATALFLVSLVMPRRA